MCKSAVEFFRTYFHLRPDDDVDKKLDLCCRYKDQFLAAWKVLLPAASTVSQRIMCYLAILPSLSTRAQLHNDHS